MKTAKETSGMILNTSNIHIIGVPEGEEREEGPEKILEEIIVENFPHMGKGIATQVQEAQRVPGGETQGEAH